MNAYALRGNNSQHFSSFRCNYKLHQEKRKKFLFFNLNKSTPNDFPESYSILFFESVGINYCEKEQQFQVGIKYQLFTLIIQYCLQGIMTKLKNPFIITFMIDGVISKTSTVTEATKRHNYYLTDKVIDRKIIAELFCWCKYNRSYAEINTTE